MIPSLAFRRQFAISTELAAFYFDHFEVPTAAEGPLTVISQLPTG